MPKLPSTRGLETYIREKNEVAVVDPSKIVRPEEKKLAEEIRTVRPLAEENSSKVRSKEYTKLSSRLVMKTFPYYILDAVYAIRFGLPPANHESPSFS